MKIIIEDLDEKSTKEILESLIKDKPLKPGSYRGRKILLQKKKSINGENMLKKENRIFKNFYNEFGWEIENAVRKR